MAPRLRFLARGPRSTPPPSSKRVQLQCWFVVRFADGIGGTTPRTAGQGRRTRDNRTLRWLRARPGDNLQWTKFSQMDNELLTFDP